VHPHSGYTLIWSIQPLPLLSSLAPIPKFSTVFSTHHYVLYLHRCYVLPYYWCFSTLLAFPSFPEFHRVVPVLQTCSTYEFVYDYVCFCVYVYLLNLSSIYEWKHVAFVFLSLDHFILRDVFQLHPFTWVKLHCVYIPHFLDPFISYMAPGLFLKHSYCE
jgi:hypothetical protein